MSLRVVAFPRMPEVALGESASTFREGGGGKQKGLARMQGDVRAGAHQDAQPHLGYRVRRALAAEVNTLALDHMGSLGEGYPYVQGEGGHRMDVRHSQGQWRIVSPKDSQSPFSKRYRGLTVQLYCHDAMRGTSLMEVPPSQAGGM